MVSWLVRSHVLLMHDTDCILKPVDYLSCLVFKNGWVLRQLLFELNKIFLLFEQIGCWWLVCDDVLCRWMLDLKRFPLWFLLLELEFQRCRRWKFANQIQFIQLIWIISIQSCHYVFDSSTCVFLIIIRASLRITVRLRHIIWTSRFNSNILFFEIRLLIIQINRINI